MTTKRFKGPDPKLRPGSARVGRGGRRRRSVRALRFLRTLRVSNGGRRGGRQSEVTQKESPWGSEDAVWGEVSP